MDLNDFVRRVDEIRELVPKALASRHSNGMQTVVASDIFANFRSASLSLLASLFGREHSYYTDFDARVSKPFPTSVEAGDGILSAARGELTGGWLHTTRGLLSAEIFADFLEMAEHLLTEGYKDAAAVIVGSSLEEHLRQLAVASSVPTTREKGGDVLPLKADSLNAELTKNKVYSKLEQKSVTAWLDLRNKAAHGQYDLYDEPQVRLMVEGVKQFMSRIPV